MIRDLIETAVREGLSFTIRMADRIEYPIPSRQEVMVEKLMPYFPPKLLITGLSYLER